MKKVLLATLALSLVSGSALASSTPVTDIESGKSSVELNYSFNNKLKSEGFDDSISSKNKFGFSLGTSLSDKWAVQYSYNKIAPKGEDIVFTSGDYPEVYKFLKNAGYNLNDLYDPFEPEAAEGGEAEAAPQPAAGGAALRNAQPPAAPAAPPAPADPAAKPAEQDPPVAGGDVDADNGEDEEGIGILGIYNKASIHSLKAFYKLDENLNAYAGIDRLNIKRTLSVTLPEDEDEGTYSTDTQTASENKTGVSAGLVGHTKLAKNLSAFASVGIGTVLKYDVKLGLQYDVTKDLGLGLSYSTTKVKGTKLTNDTPFRYSGLSLAVNYKF